MVSGSLECPVRGEMLSSVVPAKATGGNKDLELTSMDLAMKLHYIKGAYFFQPEAAQGLSIHDLKEPMFQCLELYYAASGRIRRSESGRPFIKCNDGGVRIVEAQCDKSVDEWLAMARNNDHMLAHDQVLGPDLGFSPLVFVQFTRFKCGGVSVGLSWAHVLGDAFSASNFLNLWGQIMAGKQVPLQPNSPAHNISQFPISISRKPFSLKKVDPVGDYWLTPNNSKMVTHSFRITAKQLHYYITTYCIHDPNKISDFEIILAMIWQSLSKAREDSGPNIVTICSNNSADKMAMLPSNGMTLSTVEADFCVSKVEIGELAKLIAEKRMDENGLIGELIKGDEVRSDFIVYGANLTFVNLEGMNVYGIEMKGLKPVCVNYMMNGVGEEGTVVVLPSNEKDGGNNGKMVTITLPQHLLLKLNNRLQIDWNIVI
ncbi:hypothetical protein ERO13_D01G113800v2 [Gossypium hirsutum]|uniref:Protein ECERIFERUM 2 n=1 Tax=Gossypium hirsutum TaxID=3635 RepID=A0A1U8KVQ5_GOSHI|nr:protein ECERIFERUM 2-like [Gossypium hirsutum]KAG4162406.1 hypothetical protein ERO13_D01G113800v2 [Gossypium hirsutum]